MIYFLRDTGDTGDTVEIACAESAEAADRLRAAGWAEITREVYMAWWQYFDRARFWELRRAAARRRAKAVAYVARFVGELY